MIPVRIVSRYWLEDRVRSGGSLPSHCVSITDPGEPLHVDIRPAFRGVLRLAFHDIERKSDLPPDERPRPPTLAVVRRVLRFREATRADADGYLVHCHAGVHRSVAVGLALLYLETGSEASAVEALLRVHPLPMPNRRLAALFDRALGSDLAGATEGLWTRARDFLEGRISIDRDDYLEDLDGADGSPPPAAPPTSAPPSPADPP